MQGWLWWALTARVVVVGAHLGEFFLDVENHLRLPELPQQLGWRFRAGVVCSPRPAASAGRPSDRDASGPRPRARRHRVASPMPKGGTNRALPAGARRRAGPVPSPGQPREGSGHCIRHRIDPETPFPAPPDRVDLLLFSPPVRPPRWSNHPLCLNLPASWTPTLMGKRQVSHPSLAQRGADRFGKRGTHKRSSLLAGSAEDIRALRNQANCRVSSR